jgi:ankyrin repeat protein
VVKHLVASGAGVNLKTVRGNTALMLAIQEGQIEVAYFLIKQGANTNIKNNLKVDALILTIRNKEKFKDPKKMVDLLINKGASLNNALIVASHHGYIDIVKRLIAEGADVNTRNKKGYTALIFAASQNYIDVVKFLVDKGADVNAKNKKGRTALMGTAFRGYTKMAGILLLHGADINARDNNGDTVLIMAAAYRKTEMVKLLLDYNADVNIKNQEGDTALMKAEAKGFLDIVTLLKKRI